MIRRVPDSNERLNQSDVNEFEGRHGLAVPESYRDFLLVSNGGRGSQQVF